MSHTNKAWGISPNQNSCHPDKQVKPVTGCIAAALRADISSCQNAGLRKKCRQRRCIANSQPLPPSELRCLIVVRCSSSSPQWRKCRFTLLSLDEQQSPPLSNFPRTHLSIGAMFFKSVHPTLFPHDWISICVSLTGSFFIKDTVL